ncbi:MAG TPA: CRTAC1 family protein [Chthonomonadaceae bacterium]|nr:CRTAC1 family protein [Chthonomonadaceae bacterium]
MIRARSGATALCVLVALLVVTAACDRFWPRRASGAAPGWSAPAPPPSASRIRFADITTAAGITWKRTNGAFGKRWFPETMGGGGAFIDFDGDGREDILLVNGAWWPGHERNAPRPTLVLYRNLGGGKFADVTRAVGLDITCQGMGVAIGDYDNDGFDDILITSVGGNRLFHNEGGKRFREVTDSAGIRGAGWSTSAAWIDYDNDGKLDLFVCQYVQWRPDREQFCGSRVKTYCTPTYYAGESCRLYHNEGGGRFTDVTKRAGLFNTASKALGVCIADIDGDGRPDILVANDQEPNFLYRNNGDGTFTDVAYTAGFAMAEDGRPRSGMGLDAAFSGNDGRLSVLVGNFALQGAALYRQAGAAQFTDEARSAGVLQPSCPYVTFGTLFCDLDNDGWKDAVLANGQIDDLIEQSSPDQRYAQPTLLLRNSGDGNYRDATRDAGLGGPLVGRGLAAGDIDNDGRMDLLLIPNIGAPRLLHNVTSGGHWCKIALHGTRSNRDGFGALVRVTAGGLTQSEFARSGSSYCSQSDRRLHFGVRAARIDTVEVRWPSGTLDTWHDIAADRIVDLEEGHSPRLDAVAERPKN